MITRSQPLLLKSISTLFFIALFSFSANAKKVKFGVDMTGLVISPNGVHVTGDFQTIAGFAGGDWNSASTLLSNETGTDIYSIVVDIPAFQKYEYKFVNGDQFYEVEFIPVASRVGYNFNDNRWLYVDSLAEDTTYIGALIFAGNAPAGLELIRFKVDMENIFSIDPGGVHVAGNYQGFDPSKTILYSFVPDTFEVIEYLPAGNYEFKYYNGNTALGEETVPVSCSQNGNRFIALNNDTVLPTICFSDCSLCIPNALEKIKTLQNQIQIFPNPAASFVQVNLNPMVPAVKVDLFNQSGQRVGSFNNNGENIFQLQRNDLPAGNYFLIVSKSDGTVLKEKLLFQ
jgi:alpha-amylase